MRVGMFSTPLAIPAVMIPRTTRNVLRSTSSRTIMAPAVLGINFGQSYASIAVIGKEGHADCIANEDGERQIACAVSYNGEEVYIGNGALQQLVKNSKNTIIGFRNLLGHTYAEVDHSAVFGAPLLSTSDEPAYSVDILLPAPSAPPSNKGSAAPSGVATPAPREVSKKITAQEISTLFLETLFNSATDFLGTKPTECVISCPSFFTDVQRQALSSAAKEAGIPVVQILDETAAVLVGYRVGLPEQRKERGLLGKPEEGSAGEEEAADKRVVVLDMGETSLTVTVVQVAHGEYTVLGSGRDTKLGGRAFDDLLCGHFAKEFTKKTKVSLTIPCSPSASDADKRAEAKLRLAVDHTKRSLSASAGAATCAVESLKDGMDLSASINRMRFDGLASGVYRQVGEKLKEVVNAAGYDLAQIDEVLLAGASTLFPGLSNSLSLLFPSTVPVTTTLDPSQAIAVGCALQALHIATLPDSLKASDVFAAASSQLTVAAPIGLVLPGQEHFVTIIAQGTPIPARRRVVIPVAPGTSMVALEVWEGSESVKVDKVEADKGSKAAGDDESDEDEDEAEETKTVEFAKTSILAGMELEIKGEAIEVSFEVQVLDGGKASFRLWQEGQQGKTVEL